MTKNKKPEPSALQKALKNNTLREIIEQSPRVTHAGDAESTEPKLYEVTRAFNTFKAVRIKARTAREAAVLADRAPLSKWLDIEGTPPVPDSIQSVNELFGDHNVHYLNDLLRQEIYFCFEPMSTPCITIAEAINKIRKTIAAKPDVPAGWRFALWNDDAKRCLWVGPCTAFSDNGTEACAMCGSATASGSSCCSEACEELYRAEFKHSPHNELYEGADEEDDEAEDIDD